jgi:hypothetical protein
MKPAHLAALSARWPELGGMLPLLPVLIYQGSYMNSFFPVTEGWFCVYATLIRNGALPYRDFAMLLPPLYPYFIAFLQSVVGGALLPLHWAGLTITALIGFALYLLLRGHFPPGVAGVAAAVGLVYYQSGNAFMGYDFTQILTLWLLLAARVLDRFVMLVLTRPAVPHGLFWRPILGGLFLSLAILTKHSNAGVCSLILAGALAVVLFRTLGPRTGFVHLLWLALGLLLPLTLMFSWLAFNGIIGDFFGQVVVDAAGAKGGVLTSLTQWIPGFFTDSYVARSLRIARAGTKSLVGMLLLVSGLAIILRCIGYQPGGLKQIFLLRVEDEHKCMLYSLMLAACAAVALGSVVFSVRYDDPSAYATTLWRGRRIYEQAIPAAVNLYLVGGLLSLVFFIWRPTVQNSRTFLLLAFGLGLTCGNGTSAGLSEISAFLGVALITALLLRAGLPYVLPTIIPMVTAIAFVTFLVNQKYENPYHWWSVVNPDIRHTAGHQVGGLLAGLSMPFEKCAAIQKITDAIVRNSEPDEAVYVFPHMPIFYMLANRPPFNNAVVSWFDFMSDRQAERLAQSLNDSPPEVIVFADLPAEVFLAHEQLFRGGRPMAQRKIVAVIDGLLQAGHISLIEEVPNLDGLPVKVYARTASASR